MSAMRIQRNPYRRRRGIPCLAGCTLLVILLAGVLAGGVLLFGGSLAGIVLQLSGAQRIGNTDDVFREAVIPNTPVAISGGTTLRQANLSLGAYGQYTLPNLTTGTSGAVAQVNEAEIMGICGPRCTHGDSRIRDVQVDLRPGGAVIRADMNVAGLWQRVGVAVQVNGLALDVVGVDADGILYDSETLPGDLRDLVREIERVGNDALRQMVVNAGGVRYTVGQLIVNENTVTVVLDS